MTYAEAVARLLGLRRGEITGMAPGLERIEGLLAALGHPEARFVLAQVGGTNGKGSTAAMLASMLKAAGRRVGLYTSPHLVSFRERIRVDGAPIGEDAVADGGAAEVGVPLLLEGRDLHVTVRAAGLDGQRIDCVGPDFELRDLTLPLLGTHQPSNALAAVAAARVLGVGDDAVRAGLARTRW